MSTTRVIVCEDSETDRAVLVRLLLQHPEVDVVAVARSGEEVLPLVQRFKPDVLTLDLNLPGKSGLEVIDEVMATVPTPIVVISGQASDAKVALEALAAGAVEVVEKPQLDGDDGGSAKARRLGELVVTLSRVKVIRHLRARLGQATTTRKDFVDSSGRIAQAAEPTTENKLRTPLSEESLDRGRRGLQRVVGPGRGAIDSAASLPKTIVGVAASTGGPQALKAVLSGLKRGLGCPILVVQHIAKGFTQSLVEWLDASTDLDVVMGEHRSALAPDTVYVAPEGVHMTVREGFIELSAPRVEDRHCPSADALFSSIAEEAGPLGICVVLSGMGSDGAVGAAAVYRAGGKVIVQDEGSAAVFGMPRAVLDQGVKARVADLGSVSAVLEEAVRENAFADDPGPGGDLTPERGR